RPARLSRSRALDDGVAARNSPRRCRRHHHVFCPRSGTPASLGVTMKYRTFPGTSIRASEIGFGALTISTGWWGEKTDAQAVSMLRSALDDHGVTFFDAADAYGNGRSEKQLAELGS